MAGTQGSQRLALEREYRGYRWLQAGVQGPNVAPPGVVGSIITRQEQPRHPLPFFLRPVPLTNLPRRDWYFGRQEQPRHPLPFFTLPFQRVNIASGVTTYVLGRQEQPPQFLWPPPPVRNGFPTPSEYVFGYIIGL